MKEKTLLDLVQDQEAYIYGITDEALANQLLPLGFIQNTCIRLVRHSAQKKTLCVEINSSQFALRSTEANKIYVRTKDGE